MNRETLEQLERELDTDTKVEFTADTLEQFRRAWLGKEGKVKSLFQRLREVPPEEKPAVAQKLNDIKQRCEELVEARALALESSKVAERLSLEFEDLSIPSFYPGLGATHPITRVERRIAEILKPFGFVAEYGPEIETEYYCFDALNIPKHHPARDMQDTFYVEGNSILRTHTTSVQARALQRGELPVKVLSFGRVYRNEAEDASHTAMFHQFELVWIEKGLTLSNLQALITHILRELYGKRRKVRFVPKFYPYTEPSIGPELDCSICKSKGCPACGHAGWVTVAGAGMVHRKVLEEFKYDPKEVSGFAFGMGTTRLAAQVFGIPSLRQVYENDVRALKGVVA